MSSESPWIFIGGRRHGLQLLERLFQSGSAPRHAFVLEEDPHEHEKHSAEIAALCAAKNVPFKITKRVGTRDLDTIRQHSPNMIAVMGWRTIIPEAILTLPKFGCVALHDSLLPKYRGFAPINWAIINGERETGVSLFYIDGGVDSGPVIAQRKIPIEATESAADVYGKVTAASVDLMAEYVPRLARERLEAKAQSASEATFTCSRTPEDGAIDWSAPTRRTYNLIRALSYPYPGAFSLFESRRLTIWEAHPLDPAPTYVGRVPGRVVSLGNGTVDVLTGDGILRLVLVQLENHEREPASAVIRSVRATLGRGEPVTRDDLSLLETIYQMSLPTERPAR